VAGIPVDVLVTGTPGGSSATGTIGPDRIDAEWRIDLGGRGAASRAHLVLRSAGTELVLDGPPLDGPVPDGPVRLEGAAGAVEVAWSDRAGGATLAVEGAVAGLDVELHIVWSAEHGGGVVWGSVGDEAMAIDARPSGAAVAVTGRYGGPPVWVLPAIGALLLPERLSG
jgi:hypothetical protein